MIDGYNWYHTQDDYFWNMAEGASREDVILEGIHYYDKKPFKICRAKQFEFPYKYMFNVELLDENTFNYNEEMWGEDQESIFASNITNEQGSELETMLTDTFKQWVDKNNIELEFPQMFEKIIDKEEIDPNNYCWVWTHYQGEPLLPDWTPN